MVCNSAQLPPRFMLGPLALAWTFVGVAFQNSAAFGSAASRGAKGYDRRLMDSARRSRILAFHAIGER